MNAYLYQAEKDKKKRKSFCQTALEVHESIPNFLMTLRASFPDPNAYAKSSPVKPATALPSNFSNISKCRLVCLLAVCPMQYVDTRTSL